MYYLKCVVIDTHLIVLMIHRKIYVIKFLIVHFIRLNVVCIKGLIGLVSKIRGYKTQDGFLTFCLNGSLVTKVPKNIDPCSSAISPSSFFFSPCPNVREIFLLSRIMVR